uniref:EOG090X0G12 n=1 Tax=Scapholeberis mucronata TaxID=202097 RepID=A0A4Y7NL01_9CRUS|nr:EOG090X0G12 [Scapholeberis mucronata]
MEDYLAATNSTSRNQENIGTVEDVCRDFLRNVGQNYVIHLSLPNYPLLKNCTVYADYELKLLFSSRKNFNLEEELEKSHSIMEFLSNVVFFMKQLNSSNPVLKTCAPNRVGEMVKVTTSYSKILNEIEQIGWDKLTHVNNDFTEVKLKVHDSLNREHILSVKLTSNVPEISADFPKGVIYEWNENSTLKELYNYFLLEAENYQDFWTTMEELDANCWVLEPENPSRRDTYRKIAIASNVSLKVEIDPNHPRHFPSITWLGSETAVFNFREKVLDRVEVWENDSPIHENLERLLEISLPLKQSLGENNEEYEVTCCICYSERLDGQVPSRTCDNPQCGQSFHIYCLYEWLRSLIQTTRKQGNKIFGACPYCEQPISCKPPDSSS